MRKPEALIEADSEEPLVDKTAALTLHSKRTERKKKRLEKKKQAYIPPRTLLDLPFELIMDIFTLLRPSDVFSIARTSKSLHDFVFQQEASLAREIIAWRYSALSKCFPLPVPLTEVDESIHPALQSEDRGMSIHRKPYQHIKGRDPKVICTCLTCMLRWNAMGLVVDFAHWQDNLDQGEPIPMIARGKFPEWNERLILANSAVVGKALRSPLWYARILEAHLSSTIRSIRRHGNNKGNKRRRFRMSLEDAAAETDLFLERSGPPSLDFPFHRDNYYMLEAYLPNRGWNTTQQRWMYMPASQHERDVELVRNWANRRKAGAVLSKPSRESGADQEAKVAV